MNSIASVPMPHDGPADLILRRIEIAFDAPLDAAAFAALSSDEQARARAFRRHEDAVRYASVRTALRDLLAVALEIPADAVPLFNDGNGRPTVHVAGRWVDFNVSHSGAYGLIALSMQRRVGVDIERCVDGFDWRALARSTLAEAESAWLERQPAHAQTRGFFDAWAAKEALLKAVGVGVTRGLTQLAVLPRVGARVTLGGSGLADAQGFEAAWLNGPVGYAACIAWSSIDFERQTL
jgi:4'-phosphopantetheinyl transferase